MRRRPTATTLIVAIAAAGSLLAPSASAEYLIPPENSAVSQYTEGLPSAGGERDADGPSRRKPKPAETIGAANTKALEERGSEGQKAAELLVETSPSTHTGAETGVAMREGGGGDNGNRSSAGDDAGDDSSENEDLANVGSSKFGDGSGPAGRSALDSVIAAATGDAGPLLPLFMVAAPIWGAAFAWRQRRSHDRALPTRP